MARIRHWLLSVLLGIATAPAFAGPPFDTDDPEPTDPGHWEIYAFTEVDGRGDNFEGATAVEANYGPAENWQVTVTIPLAFTHDPDWQAGLGDIEVEAKYRFYHDDDNGVQIAVFPSLSLPTATHELGEGRVTATIPVWAQKDFGKFSVFGGGGYAIHPGAGNRDSWFGRVAITRAISDRFLLGAEATREGPTSVGDRPTSTLGLGASIGLYGPFSLLLRGGPSFEDGGGKASYHLYAALGMNF